MYIIKINNMYFRGFNFDKLDRISGIMLVYDYADAMIFYSEFEAKKNKTVLSNLIYDTLIIKKLEITE